MRIIIASALALGLLPGLALAQASDWAYFEQDGQPMQAGSVSPEGGQLIFKCDDTGDGEVYAVVYSPERLRPASSRPQVRSLWLRYDGGNREEVRWSYAEQTVMAMNNRRDRNLGPFLEDLVNASTLEVRLEPTDGQPFELNFNVAGAREAIERVFESCGDGDNPLSG